MNGGFTSGHVSGIGIGSVCVVVFPDASRVVMLGAPRARCSAIHWSLSALVTRTAGSGCTGPSLRAPDGATQSTRYGCARAMVTCPFGATTHSSRGEYGTGADIPKLTPPPLDTGVARTDVGICSN